MNTPCQVDTPPLRIGLFGIGLDVYMADIIETNPDGSPLCVPLRKVFHADRIPKRTSRP